jgi:hypothetical protein
MFGVRRGVRRPLAQLIDRTRAVALTLFGTLALLAATPAPHPSGPTPPAANSLTKAQMQAMLPKAPLHTQYLVSTNKYGQVINAKATAQSKDHTFNMQTYGNALQAFIRTEDGKAISGVYTLTYDYDPKTTNIKRQVALVHPGGVDPNTEGAANVMMDTAKKEAAAQAAKAKQASPEPHPSPSAH